MIKDITTNLLLTDDGIWISNNQRKVSYPDQGNDLFFMVEDNSFWFNHRNKVITAVVQNFPPTDVLIDIGGGNGYVALALQEAGFETALLEPGIQGIQNARRRGINTVIQSTLEDAGFKKDIVGGFSLFDVLEHIEHDVDFLKQLYSYLRPQGLLYLTVPAYPILWSLDDKEAGHYRRYTVQGLTSKLKSVGFSINYASYFFGILSPAIFAFRTIPSRLKIRQSITTSTTTKEHSNQTGIIGSISNYFLKSELNSIEKKRRIVTGSSCIVVAQKVN